MQDPVLVHDSDDEPDDDTDDDAETYVIFSLTVISDHPIAAFVDVPGRRRPPRPDDDHLYAFGTVNFSVGD